MILSTNLENTSNGFTVTHRHTLVTSPQRHSPLLLDRPAAGAWAAPPAAPSGRTVRGWSPIHAPGSLRHVLAAAPLPSDLNRHGTRPRTAAAAPEGALLRPSLGHCVPRHPGRRQTVLWTHNNTGECLVISTRAWRGIKQENELFDPGIPQKCGVHTMCLISKLLAGNQSQNTTSASVAFCGQPHSVNN